MWVPETAGFVRALGKKPCSGKSAHLGLFALRELREKLLRSEAVPTAF